MGDHEDLVADGLHLGQDVGAEQNRMGLAQLPDELPDLNDLEGVQPHRGLIQNDDSGAAQQRLGNAYPLAVALGERGDAAVAHAGEPGLFHHLRDLAFQRPAPQPLGLAHEPQVFHRGLVQIKGWLLRQVADEPLGRAGLLENVVPVDAHTPACGGQAASYDVHGGGLSCAVWPQEAVDMPLLDFKGEIVHRQEISITLCQVFHCDHG